MNVTRRNFLKSLAIAPLGAAEPELLATDGGEQWLASWTGRTFRTALIGAGGHGVELLKGAVRAGGCELVGLCDVDRDRLGRKSGLESVAQRSARCFSCHREMLAAAKPEIVIVSSPDHWHFAHAKDALAHGAHVLIATPAALSIDGLRELDVLASRSDLVAAMAAPPQTFPAWDAAARQLQSGKLGRPVSAHIRLFYGRGQPAPAKPARPPRSIDWQRWCGPAGTKPFHTRWRAGAAGCGFLNQPAFSQGSLGRWGGPLIQWVLDATGQGSPTYSWALGSMTHATAVFGFPEPNALMLSWQHQPAPGACVSDGQYDAVISIATDSGRLCVLSDGAWSFFPNQSTAGVGMAGEATEQISFARLWCSICRSIEFKETSPLNLRRMLAGSEASAMAMLSLRMKRPISMPRASSSRHFDRQVWGVFAESSGQAVFG